MVPSRRRLLWLGGGVIVALLVAEAVLRQLIPELKDRTTYGESMTFNAHRFRDREFAFPKSPGVTRILVLGDSFTWGSGLNLEQTTPKILEQLLQSIDERIEVINGAKPGDNTERQLRRLREDGMPYEPDMVLLMYNVNDVEEFGEVPQGWFGFTSWCRQHSRVAELLLSRLGPLARQTPWRHQLSWLGHILRRYEENDPRWQRTQAALEEMATFCRGHGVTLLVAIYPALTDMDQYGGKVAHQRVRDTCESLRIPSMDLLPLFEHQSVRRFHLNFMDSHPNAKAHQLVAEALVPFVGEHLSLLRRPQLSYNRRK